MRPRAAFIGGLAGLCLLGHPAAAQYSTVGQPYSGGILPSLGTDGTRVGDLRPQLQSYFQTTAGPPSTTPAWLISPAMGVDVGATDNALRINSPRRADVFTVLTPSILITGDTARIKATLSYAPQLTIYATQSSQTQIAHFFNGQALGTIVPETLFLDVRGNVGLTSLAGNGINNYGSSSNNRQNSVQTISFSVTPYAEHRFGGWGTARIGYSFTRTLQDRLDDDTLLVTNPNANLNAFGTPGYGAIGNLTTQRERASFSTGENFGRWNDLLVVEAIQYNGGGSYRGAFRNQILNQVGYALTRKVTLLGGFGYQDIRYSGLPQVRIREPTWNFGGRYTPNPDSTVTVLYGRRDGITSISFDGQFAPTARTRILGRYSTGLTTDIEEAQNVLATTTVGPTGLVTDTATGAPVGTTGTFGVQNGIYKVKRLSVTGLLLQDRDSYSVGVVSEDRTTATTTPTLFNDGVIPAGTKSTSISANANWQHELTPDMSSTVSAAYSITNNAQQFLGAGGGEQRTLSVTAAVSKQFTDTLSGSVRYTFTDQSGGQAGTLQFGQTATGSTGLFLNRGSYTENLLLVGLRKRF